uniref:Secreted protein n=1 Tax=Angiostrongylus cantonensis TaxID=6313 RepID=A0A0K0CUL8_ANGCA
MDVYEVAPKKPMEQSKMLRLKVILIVAAHFLSLQCVRQKLQLRHCVSRYHELQEITVIEATMIIDNEEPRAQLT